MIQWIPVEDRLPVKRAPEFAGESDTSADVLVWVVGPNKANGRWYRGRYVYASNLGWQVEGIHGWCNKGQDDKMFAVTHWAVITAPVA